MKKALSILFVFALCSSLGFASDLNLGEYAELFTSVITITEIARTLGIIVLTLSLVAQGIIIFFGNNISEVVKVTMGKVATGGCFIGGAVALAGFILGQGSSTQAMNLNDSLMALSVFVRA